jgi:hypothetical protein
MAKTLDEMIAAAMLKYTAGAPVDVVADTVLDRLTTVLESQQVNRFADLLSLSAQKTSDAFEARGFTRHESVQMICAMLRNVRT